ncbi:hypothetical protein ACQ4PT_052179 [Festuca glaucescens]
MADLSRRHGPLMHLKLGEVHTVVVSSAELAEVVLKTNDLVFASRPRSVMLDIASNGGKGMAFAPYGERWRQMRKLCIVELLSSKQVKRMDGIRTEEVGRLVGSIAASAGATVNVSEKVAALTHDLVSLAVFGHKFAQQEEYLREFDQMMTLLGGSSGLVDLFPSSRLVRWISNGERHMRASCVRIQHIISDIVVGRKAARAARHGDFSTGGEDLLDVLIRLQEEDSLPLAITTETIGAILFDMFGAAMGTTTTALEWAMSELISHPEAMAKAQQEVRALLGEDKLVITNGDLTEAHYMRMVIKEVLRLHPPAPLLLRTTMEDCKIMGYDILQGTNVAINIFTISRDSKYWRNPEEFKPERFENKNVNYNGTYFEFIPFGAGRRQCPGIQFSSSVVEITLANFLYHFDWKLPDGASLALFDMSEKFRMALSRRYPLQLTAVPHVWLKAISSNRYEDRNVC